MRRKDPADAQARRTRTHVWRDENGDLAFQHIKRDNGAWWYRHPLATGVKCPDHAPVARSIYGEWCNRKPAIADRLLWRHVEILAALERGDRIYWCEGEKDANAAVAYYGVEATSHHNGAGLAFPGQVELLAGSDSPIALVMDHDPAGVKIAWEHARLLVEAGKPGHLITFLMPPKKGRDLAEHIYWDKADLQDLHQLSPAAVGALYDKHFVKKATDVKKWGY